MSEAQLEMAKRHVCEAEEHVTRQEQRLERLHRDGLPTTEAESLLRTFCATLALYKRDLAKMQAEAD